MGLRFRKSIKLGKYAKINFGKTDTSLSLGGKGARVTIGKKGIRKTIGIPGTGISYTDYKKYDNQDISNINTEQTKVELVDRMNNYIDKNDKSNWLPIWLSNWLVISIVICLLGIIGCFTKGLIILLLPVGFISLLVSLIIYIFKWIKSLRA